jgi:biotin carboxyl carrier protein
MAKAQIESKEYSVEWNETFTKAISESIALDCTPTQNNRVFQFNWSGKTFRAEWISLDKETQEAKIKVNQNIYTVKVVEPIDEMLKSLGMGNSAQKKMKELKAPMPGLVLKVLVQSGDTVVKDTPLIILEAMKMENVIKAAGDGVIKEIKVIEGQAVEKSAIMIEFA